MSDEPSVTVSHVPERDRYEITVDGTLAGIALYRSRPGQVVFLHTEVLDGFEGQGLGDRLARGALDDVRARGLRVVPMCPFIAGYIRRHPELRDLVPPAARPMLEPPPHPNG